MAATRVYSTAAYYVAAVVAILFGLSPKFGAVVSATPGGVLGGITVVLYGMIGLLGAKIWKENGVDFGNPVNLVPLAAGIIIAIGGVSWQITTGLHAERHRASARSWRSRAGTSPGSSHPRRCQTAVAAERRVGGASVIVDAPGAYEEPRPIPGAVCRHTRGGSPRNSPGVRERMRP